MAEAILKDLTTIAGEGNVLAGEPMSKYTTFKIGGPADFIATSNSAEILSQILQYCKIHKLPYLIIGNGSNLLISDEGIDGVVLRLGKNFAQMQWNEAAGTITAQAGALLPAVAATAYNNGLSGMEFASGIPGSVGGGCVMNAGAYDGEMKQVVVAAEFIDEEGVIRTIGGGDLAFRYRHSYFSDHQGVVTAVSFQLLPDDKGKILARMNELTTKRKEKQPLEFPSAGSAFKRPQGYFAAKLIDECGLRGYTIGGAQVSEKHCGFVINKGGATCRDVKNLLADVTKIVEEKTGVLLEPEIKFAGR